MQCWSIFSRQQERINQRREELEKQKKSLTKKKPLSNPASEFHGWYCFDYILHKLDT